MPFLFIGSTGDRAGHSLVTWTIARRLVEKGLRVGFMKPFGTHPIYSDGLWKDHDAFLFKEVLKLQESFDRICPYLVSEQSWKQMGTEDILKELKSLAQDLSRDKDILLIMGSKHIFFDDTSRPVPDISIINELNADLVLINRYREISRSIYSILFVRSMLKDRIKGIILNRVPPEKIKEIRNQITHSLSQKGIEITASIAEDPFFSFRSLREIMEILDAKLLCGEKNIDQLVGRMTVGSTDLKGELLLFKRVYNKIILLEPFSLDKGTEKPLIQRSIAGIVLTGGRNPAPQILQATKKTNLPLFLVQEDTFATLEHLEQSPPRLSPKDESKVRHFTELMDHDGALNRLLQSIGIISS